ncbi:MAG TPA: hypothetical protein VFR81_14040 [Longimicrobium sp.]|nr:hypothetical protein [Longimicrobium sp.]
MPMREEGAAGGKSRKRAAAHAEAPPVYRIVSAGGDVLAEVSPDGNPAGRGRVSLVEALPDVAVRPGHGGGLLLFRTGEPRGRTPAEALEAGWARHVQPEPRRRREPRTLTSAQLGALCRVFETWVRPGRRH